MSDGGLSAARLRRMHDVLAGYVERGEVPGLVTLVARHGAVHVDTIGTTELGGEDPMRRDTIFRITSVTKPITAVAAMILVEECVLRLDEPVDRLLPELADRQVLRLLDAPVSDTVPANRPITVRDLFTFQLGWGLILEPAGTYPIQQEIADRNILGFGMMERSCEYGLDEWLARLKSLPLLCQPRVKWP